MDVLVESIVVHDRYCSKLQTLFAAPRALIKAKGGFYQSFNKRETKLSSGFHDRRMT